MRRVLSAALLAASLPAVPALAQDTNPTFTGLRVEGLAGWDRVQSGGHDDGVVYGIGAGYDLAMGGVLVGAEAELTDSTVRECSGARTGADPRFCVRAGRDIAVGGRVGTIVGGGRTLIYAKAAYTNARVGVTADDGTGRVGLGHDNLDGVRVGGGAEFALSQNMFVKAEYRYSNYEAGLERHQVLGGFGVRF